MNKNNWMWMCFSSFLFIRCESFFEVPRIETFTFPSHVAANKNISGLCVAKDAKFFWYKDSKMLTNSSSVDIKEEEDYSIIIIRSVSVGSGGNYTCIAVNKFGMSSQSTMLTVITPPKGLIEQLDLVAVIGEKNSLECLNENFPKEIIEWKRGDRNETITKTKMKANWPIMLNAMKLEGNGTYKCIMDNVIPLATTKDDIIKEKIPARFHDKFTKVKVKKGDSVSLPCEAIGDQPLTINWKRDGRRLNITNGERFDTFETITENGLKSELFLRDIDKNDGQLYTCIAENSYGKDEKDINLLVMEVPSIPLNLKVHEVKNRDVKVSWSSPYAGNSPITKYIIRYWKDHASGRVRHMKEKAVTSAQTTAVIENLHPGIGYGLDVTAENALGSGEPSEIVLFTTQEEKPSGAPVDVNVNIKGADSLIVSWKPPPKNERNGHLEGYHVGYKKNLQPSDPYSIKEIHLVSDGKQEYIISKLQKDTMYSVFVKAFNSAGSGPPSQDVIVRTSVGDLPLAPTVSVVSTIENSVTLQWRSTDHNLTRITGHIIHYQKKEESWQRVEVTSENETSYNLTGLQNGTFYQMYITANSDHGEGYSSNIVTAETNAGGDTTSVLSGVLEHYSTIDMSHVIPVTASVLTAIIFSVAVCVWVLETKSRRNLERSIQEDKRFIFATAETQMCDYAKKKRSLSVCQIPDSTHFPTPYATMLMKDTIQYSDLKGCSKKEMKTFSHQKIEDRKLLNDVILKKEPLQQESKRMYNNKKSEETQDISKYM